MSASVTATGSSYTLNLIGTPPGLTEQSDLIKENANKAILYLGEYLKWEGVLDFALRWDNELRHSWSNPNGPGMYAYGNVLDSGLTYAQHESIFREDLNGAGYTTLEHGLIHLA